jgi:hypothetical protein
VARFSTATNATSSAVATAKETSVLAEAQPASGARTTVRTSRSMPTVTASAPATSKPRRSIFSGGSFGSSRGATTRIAAAIGTGSRKVKRQPTSVSRPPKISPSEKPLAPQAV